MAIPAAPNTDPALGFVRLTAWSMIIIGVLGFCMSLLQGLMAMLLLKPEMLELLRETPEFAAMPPWMVFLMAHFLHLAVLAWLLSVLTAVAGWGLLQRMRWALWCSVIMFWLGSLTNLIGIWLHAVFLHHFRYYWQGLPSWMIDLVEANYWSTQITGFVFGAFFAVGFGWTAWKLGSPAVRVHFGPMT